MEDTLREAIVRNEGPFVVVLILVLMEDTLREIIYSTRRIWKLCLNPCFNGRYSQSARVAASFTNPDQS